MRLKEKKLLKKFAATLKKFSAQDAKKVEYGNSHKSRSSSKLGHVGSETGFLGQIMKIPCVLSRGHSLIKSS